MKLITFPIPKEKINKKDLTIAAAIVLFAVIIGGYIWLQNTGRVSEINLGAYMGRLAQGLATVTERSVTEPNSNQVAQEVSPEDLQISLPSSGRDYEQTAQAGEGITYLARRALKEYTAMTGQGADLTAEHKIYIEDYLQKQAGSGWLELGEKVSFSEEAIKEAIAKSRQLAEDQLQNLKQFSAKVSSL